MAAAQHKLSRRALLGAACAGTALVGRSGGAVSGLRSINPPERLWPRALAMYARAEAALEFVTHTEDDDVYDYHLGRFNSALRRLLRTPAPNLTAFAAKLDLLVDHEAWELTGGDLCIAALRRDAHRFAS
jgi:hypothetical protein